MRKRTDEQIIAHEASKLNNNPDPKAVTTFFRKALAIQTDLRNYDAAYLDRKMFISCEVLAQCGACRSDCSCCALALANQRAKQDIELGIRFRPDYLDAPKAKPTVIVREDRTPAVSKRDRTPSVTVIVVA